MNEGRNGHWLNRDRVSVYSRVVAVSLLVGTAIRLWFQIGAEPPVMVPNLDFNVFYVASQLVLAGNPQDAYNAVYLNQQIQKLFPGFEFGFFWMYPISFYLAVSPLALLPYFASYLVFMLSTLAGYVVVLRRIIKGSTAMWCLAAFPGVWMNFILGQNGFLTAFLAGGALLSLQRRPIWSGVFLGLLSIKPHLCLLFPVALIAIRAWRTLMTAAIVAVLFTAVSTIVLGEATLLASLGSTAVARELAEHGGLWGASPTVFGFLRLLGVSVALAYVGQAIFFLVGILAVWKVWRSTSAWSLRGSVLITATFFASPYLLPHDLVWLGLPIAWLAHDAMTNGWRKGEKEVLFVAWLLPIAMSLIGDNLGIQIGPFVMMALLWVIVRRTFYPQAV